MANEYEAVLDDHFYARETNDPLCIAYAAMKMEIRRLLKVAGEDDSACRWGTPGCRIEHGEMKYGIWQFDCEKLARHIANCRTIAELDLNDVILAVDFDGTCAMHDFPEIGPDVPGAVEVLRALSAAGAKLILWTIRSDQARIKNDPHSVGAELSREFLQSAVKWFGDREIPLGGVNCNEQQREWSSSPKCYAHAYLDDAAIGCPLVYDAAVHRRPFVDWGAMATLLIERFGGGGK